MDESEYIVNSLLCFLNSGKKDYPYETLFDIISSFYCYEEIKKGKELLCGILNEDVCWRRDPDKKRKEVKDVIELHERIIKSKKQVNFVTDSHKRMPPIGLEKFGPLLTTLSEDTARINELLPKIMDIKTEVINTADTVRQMKVDFVELKSKFTSAVSGLDEATRDLTMSEMNVLNDVTSFRCTSEQPESLILQSDASRKSREEMMVSSTPDVSSRGYRVNVAMREKENGNVNVWERRRGDAEARRKKNDENEQRKKSTATNRNEVVNVGVIGKPVGVEVNAASRRNERRDLESDAGTAGGSSDRTERNTPASLVTEERTGAITKGVRRTSTSRSPVTRAPTTTQQNSNSSRQDDWTMVNRGAGRRNSSKRVNTGVTGLKKCEGSLLKGAIRLIDVFIGRVDNDVTCEDLTEYIKDVFKVQITAVMNLNIKTDEHKAFKVTVKLAERNKLFNPELWPENIVVDKFFNRSRGQVNKESN